MVCGFQIWIFNWSPDTSGHIPFWSTFAVNSTSLVAQ